MSKRLIELRNAAMVTRIDDCGLMPFEYDELDVKKFIGLVINECMSICTAIEKDYKDSRLASDDFDDKNMFGAGEDAAIIIRGKIEDLLGDINCDN